MVLQGDIFEGFLCFLDVTDQVLPPHAPNYASHSRYHLCRWSPCGGDHSSVLQLAGSASQLSKTTKPSRTASAPKVDGLELVQLPKRPSWRIPSSSPGTRLVLSSSVQGLHEPLSQRFSLAGSKKKKTCMYVVL